MSRNKAKNYHSWSEKKGKMIHLRIEEFEFSIREKDSKHVLPLCSRIKLNGKFIFHLLLGGTAKLILIVVYYCSNFASLLVFYGEGAKLGHGLLPQIATAAIKLAIFWFSSFQGLTVRMEGNKVAVARILIDSIIDRQDLLRTGDVILQANGKNIKDPEQLQTAIEESGPFVVFKIQPSNVDQQEIESTLPKAGKVAKVQSSTFKK